MAGAGASGGGIFAWEKPHADDSAAVWPDEPAAEAEAATVRRFHVSPEARSSAVYSPCEHYRYDLTRVWQPEGARLLFVMLNPSKATEAEDDPTIARCVRRAQRLGYGAVRICNIFAWRETDPRRMRAVADPVGPGNAVALRAGSAWADRVLCGWGGHGVHLGQGRRVEALLRGAGRPLCHLGLTKDGQPRHPLYIGYAELPRAWD